MGMDVTNNPPSVAFTLDAQATPSSFHRFIREQPGNSHVTMEFRVPRDGGGQRIPVVRVVHIGEREVFTEDSRAALVGRLRDWNDALLGQPGAREAAQQLNAIVGTVGDLSLDVCELAPVMAAMSDVHAAAHPNSFVKAWRERSDEVMRILVPDDPEANPKRFAEDRNALAYALKLLSRFSDGEGSEIGNTDLLELAWNLGHDISPGEQTMLQTAWWCLQKNKGDVRLRGIIGQELIELLALCKDAKGTGRQQFKASEDNKKAVFRIMEAQRINSAAHVTPPDSPYATPTRSRAASSLQQFGDAGAGEKTQKSGGHRRTSSMTVPLINTPPTLTSTAAHAGEHPDADRTKQKTTLPKSPRREAPAPATGSQTVKEKQRTERPSLRRVRTDAENEAEQHSGTVNALVSPRARHPEASAQPALSSSDGQTTPEKTKRRLKRAETVAQEARDADASASPARAERKSGKKSSSGKSSKASSKEASPEDREKSGKKSSSGKSSKASSKEASPEDREKPVRSLPRKTRREHSGESDLVTHQRADTTGMQPDLARTSAKKERSSKETNERRLKRVSQPTHMELQQMFASEDFRKTKEELASLPDHRVRQRESYPARTDGRFYLAWQAYVSGVTSAGDPQIAPESAQHVATLLSYCPELPLEPVALRKTVDQVVRSAKLKREPMLAVKQAWERLEGDSKASGADQVLTDLHILLSLALQSDNERRINANLQALF
jgi:hypothetical protein